MDRSRRAMLAGMPAAAVATLLPEDVLAAPAGLTTLVEGERPVDRDTVIDGAVVIRPGARFVVARGATLTLRGDLIAPAERVFGGEGGVDLSHGRLLAARPEWWGARADDPAVDCEPALSACLRAHPAMQLGPGDYHLGRTWLIDQPNRRVWGVGRTNGARGARLLLKGGNAPVVLVGNERAPAEINSYLRGVDLRWLELGRTEAAQPPDDQASTATGLAIRHVLDCTFEGLRANEHAVGYSIRGAVRTFLRDCAAFRSLFPDQTRDTFVGFEMDGRAPPIATGANASLYLVDCLARTGGRPHLPRSIGCWLRGALSDTFLVRLETTEVAHGIKVDGEAESLGPAGRRSGHVDLHIETPVLDQCFDAGLSLSGLSEHALVDVTSPYVALAAGGRAAVEILRSGGQVSVAGGQLIGPATRDPVGLSIREAAGVSVVGLKLAGWCRPAEVIDARGCDMVLSVDTAGVPVSGAPALRLERVANTYCRPRVDGPAGANPVGVASDGGIDVTVETAGISRRAVTTAVTVEGRPVAPPSGASAVVVGAAFPA